MIWAAFFISMQQYQLSDIIIDSVGLVSRAAVTAKEDEPGTNFLLLKSREGENMADDVTIEVENQPLELPDKPPEGWKDVIKSWFAKQEDDTSNQDVQDEGEEVVSDENEETTEDEPMVKNDNNLAIHEIVKAEVKAIREQYTSVLDEVKKANTELQADLTKAREEITALRQDRDTEKSARRKREFLEKGMGLRMLPLADTELGELLMKAADGMPDEDYERLEALLKATDRQLGKANILYGEIGTARTPEQATIEDKVAKSDNPAQALLELDEDDQAKLIKEWDKQATGR